MPINILNNFLDKFKKLTPPDLFIRKTIQEEVLKETQIELDLNEVKYDATKNLAYIKSSHPKKMEIFIKKEKIIRGLKSRLGKKSPGDIL